MTYKDIQEAQNAADAHAFLNEQPNADKLYVRRTGDLFTVRPIVILDADNIPVRDGDILFLRNNRYCRAKIVKCRRSDDAHNVLFQGMCIEGDANDVVVNFGENDGRAKIVSVKHHRRDKRERLSSLEWICNIVEVTGGLFDIFPYLALLIILVTLPLWLVVLIVWAVTTIRDEKILKKAETAEAALIFADECLSSESNKGA